MIYKTKISKSNEQILSSIFRRSFNKDWISNVPFIDDTVYVIKDQFDQIIGFAMIHPTTPFPTDTGVYLYNLAIDPDFRNAGYGKKLVTKICSLYDVIYTHSTSDYFAKLNFGQTGIFRDTMEMRYPALDNKEFIQITKSDHYDPIENIIYL